MTDPVTVPGTGKQISRRGVIIGGGLAVVAVLAVLVYRHKRAQAAAAAPTVDTTTGSTLQTDGYQNPNPVRTQDNTVDLTGNQVTTNAQWTQYALAQMGNWDPTFVEVALGLFLADQPLTTDQATVVRTAEGLAGPPPEGHHVIILASDSSTPGTPAPSTTPPPSTTPAEVPQFLTPPVGVNLYDWTGQIRAQYGLPLDLMQLRVLNGGSTAASNNPFDNAHINWVAVPGPPGTPKAPLFKNPTALRIR